MIPTNEIHNEIYYFAPFNSYMSRIDCFGNVRWYIDQTDSDYDDILKAPSFCSFILLDNGHFLPEDNSHTALVELDSLGRIYEFTITDFDIHHQFLELDDGNYLVQSQVNGAPTTEDTLTVLEKGTGEIMKTMDYKHILDPNRAPQPYSDNDWLHANSIYFNENNKFSS